jgi:hypothetical protein
MQREREIVGRGGCVLDPRVLFGAALSLLCRLRCVTVVANAGCILIGRAKVKGPFMPEAPRQNYHIGYSVYCCYDNTAVLAFARVLASDISKGSIWELDSRLQTY